MFLGQFTLQAGLEVGGKEVSVWTTDLFSSPLPPSSPSPPKPVKGSAGVLSAPPVWSGVESQPQTHFCDIMSPENASGGNKTVSAITTYWYGIPH